MKTILLLLLLLFSCFDLAGQALPDVGVSGKPAGDVKSVTYERTMLVRGGISIPPADLKLIREIYDRQGRTVTTSIFGNVEQRFSFDHSTVPARVTLSYFDQDGKPTSRPFVPHMNAASESDLCTRYTIRNENDRAAKIERSTEVCEDGTVRAVITSETDSENRVFRESRTDALKRTWESKYRYDREGEVIEHIYLVDDKREPYYWQMVSYADIKYDKQRNWTQKVGSSFHSKAPNRLVYQFLEKRTIEYYEN